MDVIPQMSFSYPYELIPQPEGGFTVTLPDIPEAITQGETEEEAAAMAEDALVTACLSIRTMLSHCRIHLPRVDGGSLECRLWSQRSLGSTMR